MKKIENNKSLEQWLSYYENLHNLEIDMGLKRVLEVWERVCEQNNITKIAKEKIITVAGTNGKGSSCKMLVLILKKLGYKVGCFTSPHILKYNERIQINDLNSSDEQIINAFKIIEKARGETTLSYFEVATLASFIIFAQQKVDFAILEVGLGGRLDSTNIINADAAIITGISVDHTNFLGNNIDNIAIEKAGVFRENQVSVYADEQISRKLISYCKDNKITLNRLGYDYQISYDEIVKLKSGKVLQIPNSIISKGKHQQRNLAGILQVLDSFSLLENIENITECFQDFNLIGRLQKVSSKPDIIVDVAHNQGAANNLAEYIRKISEKYNQIYFVIGILKDKNISEILNSFVNIDAKYFLAKLDSDRTALAKDLKEELKKISNKKAKSFDSVNQALMAVKNEAKDNDLIVCFGSFFVVSKILDKIKKEN